MATFLSNAVITVTGSGSPVVLSSQGNTCTITAGRHALTSTAFGDTGDMQTPGLNFWNCSVELYLDYGSSSVEETLYDHNQLLHNKDGYIQGYNAGLLKCRHF